MSFTLPAKKSLIGKEIMNLVYKPFIFRLCAAIHWKYFEHCNENLIYVFAEKKMRGLSPNFHIHVSVSDLYIPRIGPHVFPQNNINRSRGRAFPFLGIFVLNFPYCVFVVRMKPLQYKIFVTSRQPSFGIFRIILTFLRYLCL